jgi:hypothetical protein
MGKKMLILRGNADNDGDQYPDETGKNVKWPIGALHVGAAEDYAKQRGYDPETLAVRGDPQNYHSPQTQEVLKRFDALKFTKGSYVTDSSLKADQDIHAFYGFSGGGYNVWWILWYLAKNKPDELRRIDLVVALGVVKKIRSKPDYAWPAFKAIAKDKVNLDLWDAQKWKDGWELVYHTNPPRSLLPTTLPKKTRDDIDTHMFGPAVLLAGHWEEET